jgi:hypothetical protein
VGWREHLRVHPTCERLPKMGDAELVKLGKDIEANRLQEPIKLVRDGDGYAVLDGRSRLDAHEVVGLPIQIFDGSLPNRKFFEVVDLERLGISAAAYVTSANVHRRHLTPEMRNELLADLIKADPTKSDRQLAKDAGVSHPTIAKVRAKVEEDRPDVETNFHVDTQGRKQPAHKPPRASKPAPTKQPPPARPKSQSGSRLMHIAFHGVIDVPNKMNVDFKVVAGAMTKPEVEAALKDASDSHDVIYAWEEALGVALNNLEWDRAAPEGSAA